MYLCDRGDGLQLFLPAHEANVVQLPTRGRHGPTLRQHAIPHSGMEHASFHVRSHLVGWTESNVQVSEEARGIFVEAAFIAFFLQI